MPTGCAVLLGAALVSHRAAAAPSVWIVDDGEKIRRDAVSSPFESGEQNPVWRPGQRAHLVAMRNETVALQVVVEADGDALDGVTVDLASLESPDGTKLEDKLAYGHSVDSPIERFVEHFVEVRRASGSKRRGESRGWEPGSGPAEGEWVGLVPDALIPVELAPPWDPYPLIIEPRSNGIVWIDLNVSHDQATGVYGGEVIVRATDRDLARLPIELEVADAILPDRTVATALSYDHEELEERAGPRAERQLWQLLHRHRIAPLDDATSTADVDRELPSLSGALYTPQQGYVGPGQGVGDGVLAIGAHGAFRDADEGSLARVKAIADRIADQKLFGGSEVVFYAAEDECSSPWGSAWRTLLRNDEDANARRLRVGWTCSQDPTEQPVDVPMMRGAFDTAQVNAARKQGKESWVVDGVLPRTGSFLVDDDAVSPRVNGWLSAMFRVPRWLVTGSTHWYAEHGDVPLDPFDDAESFEDPSGAHANGEGMLLYPGTQRDAFEQHSLGFQGVLPSIRLKNWRRGIEDAGYLQMARDRDPARADAVARWLVPTAFGEAKTGEPASWGPRGKPFFEARQALLAIILGRAPVALDSRSTGPSPHTVAALSTGCSRGASEAGGGATLLLVAGAMGAGRLRRRRMAQARGRSRPAASARGLPSGAPSVPM